ncbi:MAG: family 1 glycosylhydrolase [Parasphingorhabdus sp.]
MDAGTTAGTAVVPALLANTASITTQRPAPTDFLWGAAISAYQNEGDNISSDSWLAENLEPTLFKDRSSDACDSYLRYDKDFALAQQLGLNCYRLGVEWARIEPATAIFHMRRWLTISACSKPAILQTTDF